MKSVARNIKEYKALATLKKIKLPSRQTFLFWFHTKPESLKLLGVVKYKKGKKAQYYFMKNPEKIVDNIPLLSKKFQEKKRLNKE